MNYDTIALLVARARAFMYELLSAIALLIVSVLLDFFGSEAFKELITKHFGDTTLGVLLLMLVSAVVKHIRNVKVLGDWKRLGMLGDSTRPLPELI